jgi:hydrogenase-1 operon protein HyaE
VPEAIPSQPRHPLLERLVRDCGIPEVDAATIDAFLARDGDAVLFFSEDPKQYPESADVAVVLPELLTAFRGRLRAAFVARESERELQKRFGFARWPALVFVRDGEYVGTITGIHDWDVYIEKVQSLLAAPTRREAAADAARANRAATPAPQETP